MFLRPLQEHCLLEAGLTADPGQTLFALRGWYAVPWHIAGVQAEYVGVVPP